MNKQNIYIETYGCQMNLADTEIVQGVLNSTGYKFTNDISQADVVLVNTCAIREHAEERIYGRLGEFRHQKKQNPNLVVGVLGCMAERLRKQLIEEEKVVDLIVGPDEYRRVPELIENAFVGEKGIAVRLSKTETYDDIIPYREDGISAWISVMRGCDKFCTFCVVPFTRGRERSRPLESIIDEVRLLSERGFKEVNLLGQNVNSYQEGSFDFADLLYAVSKVDKNMRVRFTTSHPQDLSDKLIQTIAENDNICNYIHLPVQSGSNRILQLMNRTYTIEHFLNLVGEVRRILWTRKQIPGVSFSTDIISGFPTETEEDHQMTLEVMKEVRFDGAFMFKYSARENTKAWGMSDDVSEEVKSKRLSEIIDLQQKISYEINQTLIGKTFEILIEDLSKKSTDFYMGRTDTNKIVIVPKGELQIGDYCLVKIDRANSATLFASDGIKIEK
ncbi:MAG: tRNA (N6-isopentenyl adenosine(37)-C2)-methylthiotransferase MiaB [Bacteroidetes bacterium]|nr:tRNA (N6-isopentenyl adenosine(37)-C2)-methylthiotransferase MiaB [Bacteroidota bacterium]